MRLSAQDPKRLMGPLLGPLKCQVPYLTKGPKRDHNFDNHPQNRISIEVTNQVNNTAELLSKYNRPRKPIELATNQRSKLCHLMKQHIELCSFRLGNENNAQNPGACNWNLGLHEPIGSISVYAYTHRYVYVPVYVHRDRGREREVSYQEEEEEDDGDSGDR